MIAAEKISRRKARDLLASVQITPELEEYTLLYPAILWDFERIQVRHTGIVHIFNGGLCAGERAILQECIQQLWGIARDPKVVQQSKGCYSYLELLSDGYSGYYHAWRVESLTGNGKPLNPEDTLMYLVHQLRREIEAYLRQSS